MEINRREHGLVGLRIGRPGDSGRVSFHLDLPDDIVDAAPGPLEGPTVTTAALGLPDAMPRGDLPEAEYGLPTPLRDWIEAQDRFQWIDWATRTGLWLHVQRNHPLLPMVPWERLLADVGVAVPVLRLPGWLGRPPASPTQPSIALWMTMPRAKTAYSWQDVVGRVVDAALALPTRPRLHVFTDAMLADPVEQQLRAAGLDATVHDPASRDPASPAPGTPGSRARATHPWLSWMEEALGSTSVDVLHVVGHGYLAGDTPGFATAQSPVSDEDTRWARFVWPNEIAGTMTRIGAVGAVVTAVPFNYSTGALRLLAASLASERAGPSVFQQADGDEDALATAYRLLLAHPTDLPDSTRSMAITANPNHFGVEPERRSTYTPTTSRLATTVAEGTEEAPAWAAPVQGQVATWETKLTTMGESSRADALRAGLELTKQRLDELLVADQLLVADDRDRGLGEVEA